MTDKELERKLANALVHTAPNNPDGVLSRCETRKGNVIPMKTTTSRSRRSLIAACLVLVLVGGATGTVYQQTNAVASVVSLDVNPSIELTVNKNERVLSCTGLNTKAAAILADMGGGADLKNTKLDVAVNAIVGALVRNGYLDDISSAILISVEDKDQTRAAKLRQELTAAVDTVLQGNSSGASVLSQTVAQSKELETRAKKSNISTGKAALVDRVLALNSTLTFENLAALSVEELKDLAEIGAPAMPIGKEAAKTAVISYTGIQDLTAVHWEIDPELDEHTPHYEVSIDYLFREYEYTVDAFSGQVLSGKKDILASVVTPADTPTDPPSDVTASDSPGLSAQVPVESPETTPSSDGTDIGKDAAIDAALRHAGLTKDQVTRLKAERDRDDGRAEYEIEFKSNGMEYEYTIDARTGSVLEHEKEWDD